MNFIIIALATFFVLKPSPEPVDGNMQSLIIKRMGDEISRLDGEGLLARKGNRKLFKDIVKELSDKAHENKTLYDFYNTFQKLDGAYTNLHSRAIFPKRVHEKIKLPLYQNQSVWLFSDLGEEKVKIKAYAIKEENTGVQEGDELVAINGRGITEWLDENFEYCKFPLRIQCDRHFEAHLLSLRLSWKGDKPLVYHFKAKDGGIAHLEVKFSEPLKNKNPLRKRCDYKSMQKYPGFELKYMGFYTCVFESKKNPEVVLIRISSFHYPRRRNSQNPFKDLREEVSSFEEFWLKQSGKYKELIFDVINNHGGNAPIPYYQLFFKGKFQEQFVRFKKIRELENDGLRKNIFWSDKAHELSYQRRLKNGEWDKLKYGEFTTPEPMFCADEKKPCEDTKFQAKKHSFNGNVSIMLNEKCISSCDGFVWALKKNLNAKLYGFPQAADSAYSRLRVDVIRDKKSSDGFRIMINPQRAELDRNHIIGQVVAVTRSSDERGNSFNGSPLALEKFVPYRINSNYHRAVLETILNDLDRKE